MNTEEMKAIKEYTTPSGKARYGFNLYLGVDDKGHSIQVRKQGYKSQKEALKAYLKLKLMVVNGEYVPKSQRKLTFNDLYEMWLKVYKSTVVESTFATTCRYFDNHILPILKDEYVDKLTVLKCQKAVNQWFNEAPHTYKRFIRYVNNVLDYGITLEVISKNPMDKVFRPKIKNEENKPFTDFYSKDELKKFLAAAKEVKYQYFVYFRLLAYSGLRKGESLALKWSDIDFKNNTIDINKALKSGENNRLYVENPKTKDSFRTLDMDDETMFCLKHWRTIQREQMLKLGYNFLSDDNLVFANLNNGVFSPSKPDQWNRKICKKAKLRRIKIHGFRHTHASLLFAAGVPMQDVKERLGHASINTTIDIYTHTTKEEKSKAAKLFEQYMD